MHAICSEIQVEVIDVVDGHVRNSRGAASAVLEVDVLESFGDDPAHFLVVDTGVAGVEEARQLQEDSLETPTP